MKLNLYAVDFSPMYPVPSGLVILANSKESAFEIAKKTVTHCEVLIEDVSLIESDCEKVIFYESGDY